jgi:hypothetical protein
MQEDRVKENKRRKKGNKEGERRKRENRDI